MTGDRADAVVIGSGPNGLVAACLLARAGWDVVVLERAAVAGGAVLSEELTVPGYVHDTCSAFYGLLHASPVFAELDLGRRLEWATFDRPVAAAASPDAVAAIHRDAAATAAHLGEDGPAWTDLCRWWDRVGRRMFAVMLAPLPSVRPTISLLLHAGPRRLLEMGHDLLEPLETYVAQRLQAEAARALLASGITHTDLSVDATGGTPFALILAMVAQTVNMPVPVGGAGQLAAALTRAVVDAGGRVLTGQEVTRVVVEGGRVVGVETAAGLRMAARRSVLADTGPAQLFLGIVGQEHLPESYLAGVRRFRYGTGIFKVDLALDGPVPWKAEELGAAGVVHLAGDLAAMARSSFEARRGELPSHPLLVVGQQTVADPSRAPAGGHTLWIETHVPSAPLAGGWDTLRQAFLDRVLDRLEEHAPGLQSRIVGTSVRTPPELEAANPNLAGGDLGGGSIAVDQQLVFRPVPGWFRYRTPIDGLYLCSASAHPGGGVHGMVGRNCARQALRDARWRRLSQRGRNRF